MKNLKERGITLIALVITIIILLILAGVTISLIWNGGIINKSQQAVDAQSEAQAREELSLALVEYKMKILMEKDYNGTLDTFLSTKPDTNSDEKWVARDAEEDNNYYEVEIGEWLFWVNKQTNEIISKGKKNPVPPTALSFKASSYDVNIGEDLNLLNELNITPTNANKNLLEWTISNIAKATIINGIVHGLEETTDAITVTVKSKEDASVNASCTINVKPIELTGITLPEKITVAKNKTKTIEVTYTPTNATYKDLSWKVDDESTDIATVANGVVTGVAVGKKTITATSTKYAGVSASCEVTVEEILEISNLQELKDFRDSVNGVGYDEHGNQVSVTPNRYSGKKVVLTADINLDSAEEWTPIGISTTKYFKGTFDGQGHTISGLYINKPNDNNQGLFGVVYGNSEDDRAVLKNVVLQDVCVSGSSGTAGLVGNAEYVEINKCMVSGQICYNRSDLSKSSNNIGGIVGVGHYMLINNCINYAKVGDSYTNNVGGIIGNACNANILKCVNLGEIKSDDYTAGGINGKLEQSSIEYCFNTGNVSGNREIGGITGRTSITKER